MKIHIPHGVNVVMGHTRMTTQGNAQFNQNNHPFLGKVDGSSFALAHNGVSGMTKNSVWKKISR
nr:class II glutamine amidotransferase [Butyricicoccus sp. OF13-6]